MLVELNVRNFAVIEETRLALGGGLNVVTGETGAGKSLLVDALEFVLGGPADRGLIRSGADAASVEAVFHLPEPQAGLQTTLAALDAELDEERTLALFRETHREGRTVSRLNGRSVPVSVVRDVGALLVDIHGQGTHLSLLDHTHQRTLLDTFAGDEATGLEVTSAVAKVRRLEQEAASLAADSRQAEQQRDLWRFQAEEIAAAELSPSEEEALVGERGLLANARAIQEACAAAHEALYGGGSNAGDLIAEAVQLLRRAPDPTGALAPQIEALEASAAQVEEAARSIRSHAEALAAEPGRLEEVEDRLDAVRRLKRKYGDTEEAVVTFGEEAQRQLDAAEHADEHREELAAELASARERAGKAAWTLSLSRRRAAEALPEAIAAPLDELGLGHVRLEVAVSQSESAGGLSGSDGTLFAFDESGIDQVAFQVETNVGEGLKPLSKVASGGETSRFMLALTSALQSSAAVPTLVFDEIDAGVGARASEIIGRRLWSLGRGAQVLCVTHLPQIAAYADCHFRVEKSVAGERTFAGAQALDGDGRLKEIAEMLGGKRSGELEDAARQMLESAAKGRRTAGR